jgi:uncharacterized membrane protein YdjX (TVP38/TMEM64 family)
MSKEIKTQHWQKLVALAFWMIIIGSGFGYAYVNDLSGTELLLQIIELLKTPFGPLIYVLIYAIRPLTFLSAVALTLAAGSIFGSGGPVNFALAVIYTVVASHVSASVAFMIGRYLGEGLIKEDENEKVGLVQRWAKRMRENTFEAVLTMRVLFFPFDFVSYLAGFLRVSWLTFISASILGSLAGTVAFLSFGASLSIEEIIAGKTPEFNSSVFFFGLVLMAVSFGISRYFKQREVNN